MHDDRRDPHVLDLGSRQGSQDVLSRGTYRTLIIVQILLLSPTTTRIATLSDTAIALEPQVVTNRIRTLLD